ncbi:putative (S)-2-hydroxy-acid oxidase [Helianthus anomalus]
MVVVSATVEVRKGFLLCVCFRRDLDSQSRLYGLSFMSTFTIEEVSSSSDVVRFFELYVYKRREMYALMVKRVETNGFKGIILTADNPKLGRGETSIKKQVKIILKSVNFPPMIAPQLKSFEGLMLTENVGSNLEAFASRNFDPSLSWKNIAWLKSITKMPIMINCVLTREEGKTRLTHYLIHPFHLSCYL